MKICNNTSTPVFHGGLTNQMRKEIANSDIKTITDEFVKNGIVADFQGNKVVAWCSLKCLEIAKKLGLGLPAGVYVRDFRDMWHEDDKNSFALCTYSESSLFDPNTFDTPAKTIFFNSMVPWEAIDSISDDCYERCENGTNYFLEVFLHEFSHAMHGTNLDKKGSVKKLEKSFVNCLKAPYLKKFQKKYEFLLSNISFYATLNPFEAVACDLSKRIINNLDKEKVSLKTDFIADSPYRETKFFEFNKDQDRLSKVIRKFWNGKF